MQEELAFEKARLHVLNTVVEELKESGEMASETNTHLQDDITDLRISSKVSCYHWFQHACACSTLCLISNLSDCQKCPITRIVTHLTCVCKFERDYR